MDVYVSPTSPHLISVSLTIFHHPLPTQQPRMRPQSCPPIRICHVQLYGFLLMPLVPAKSIIWVSCSWVQHNVLPWDTSEDKGK